MSTPNSRDELPESPVSPTASKQVSEYIRSEYFLRVPESDPLIAAVVRDPEALRALLTAKNKTASERRVAKQIAHIGGMLRTLAAVEKPMESVEVKTDRLIGNVESGFASFVTMLSEKADRSERFTQGSWLRGHLDSPGQIVEGNKSNPLRNHMRLIAASRGQNEIRMEHNYVFYYRAGNRPGMAAAFSPMEHLMILSDDVDASNLIDMLVVGHEAKHVQLDGGKRNNFQSREEFDRYRAFLTGQLGQKPRVDLTEELFTYAWEIEAANLAVDDRLRQGQITNGKMLLRALGGRPDQEDICDTIVGFAKHYYPHGMKQGEAFPQAYTNVVGRAHERVQDVCVVDPRTQQWKRWR